jgi:hypothetical protein
MLQDTLETARSRGKINLRPYQPPAWIIGLAVGLSLLCPSQNRRRTHPDLLITLTDNPQAKNQTRLLGNPTVKAKGQTFKRWGDYARRLIGARHAVNYLSRGCPKRLTEPSCHARGFFTSSVRLSFPHKTRPPLVLRFSNNAKDQVRGHPRIRPPHARQPPHR